MVSEVTMPQGASRHDWACADRVVIVVDVEEAIPAVARADEPVATLRPVRATDRRRGPVLQLGLIRRFEWTDITLPISSLPPALDGLRILHLSDLHLHHAYHPAYYELAERVQTDPPDLIFLTGDFVENKIDFRPAWPIVERVVSGLRARLGMFAVTGNHDGDLIVPRLASLGLRVLTTDALRLDIDGHALELIGLAGAKRRDLHNAFLQSLPPKDPSVPRIVLAHYPDLLRRIPHLRADVVLAGHTHGGQVCLPGGVPIIRHDKLPRRFASGVHRIGADQQTWLVVSRGMGFSKYAVRLFCPAQVVDITLTRESRAG